MNNHSLAHRSPPRRILAVKLADMGDTLLIVPALRALKTAYPAARLEVLTTAAGRSGLEGLPYIDKLITFDKYQFDTVRESFAPANLWQAAAFLAGLRTRGYDITIFFHHFSLTWGVLKFRGLALASGAALKVGLYNRSPYAGFLNVRVEDRGFGQDGLSERGYWRQLVEALWRQWPGIAAPYDERPEIAISPAQRARGHQILDEIRDYPGQPVIALGPGGGGYTHTRRWPLINFARLVEPLSNQYGAKIVVLGSQDEQGLGEQIRSLAPQPQAVVNLAGCTGLKEAGAVLEQCRLFIGNDGGLAQLAGVVGIPATVIFGPTNHLAWAPFGTEPDLQGRTRVRAVQSPVELPCRPCLYRGLQLGSRLGCAARPCLTTLTPAQVLETIAGLE